MSNSRSKPPRNSTVRAAQNTSTRRPTTCARATAVSAALAAALAAPASDAQSARDRLVARLRPADSYFLATDQLDLSPYSTASRNQSGTGDCVGFSTIAAIEAAFNHKYCAGGNNAFRQDGYCERFDAIMSDTDRTTAYPIFFWTTTMPYPNQDRFYKMDKKELDLSELFYLHRVFTQQMAGPGNHETESIMNFMDNQIAGTAGPLTNGFSLPEESYAPFINPANNYWFWGNAWNDLGSYVGGANFAQSKIDAMEFTDTPISTLIPGSPLNRPFISSATRSHARFTVTDYFEGTFDGPEYATAEAKIRFLERLVYSDFEVALHGAWPGHSMLLVGYDRANRTFHFKNHYRNWSTVPYDIVATYAHSYHVVMDVAYNAPSREEMWLGDWDLDIDGQVGHLILRRTRQPTNSHYSTTSGNY